MTKLVKRPPSAAATGTKKRASREAGSAKKKRRTKKVDGRSRAEVPAEKVSAAPPVTSSRQEDVGFGDGIIVDLPSPATERPTNENKGRGTGAQAVSPEATTAGSSAPRGKRRRGKRGRRSPSPETDRRADAGDGAPHQPSPTSQSKKAGEKPPAASQTVTRSGEQSEAGPAEDTAKRAKTGRKRGRRTRSRPVELAEKPSSDDVQESAPAALAAGKVGKTTGEMAAAAHEIDFDVSEYGSQDAESVEDLATTEKPAGEEAPRGTTRRKSPSRKAVKKTPPKEEAPGPKREMLINVSDGDECRITLLQGGRLEELYIERATSASNVGNIYKGRVTNVESSIQAAFIDFGMPSHGFLHISDLHPKYFPDSKGEPELVGKKTPRRHRPPIQNCLRPGQEVMVQVIKEGIGTKGPTLSSYISLPGRFLVMMPDMSQLGVSRKIEDEDQRRKLREMLGQLSLPNDTGFIVRTAGVNRTKRDLQRDLNYLTRLWKTVAKRIKEEPAPAELYKESDLVIRTIRDVYDSSLGRIIVDCPAVAERVREFLAIASPRSEDIVQHYDGAEPLFHKFGIESEINKLHNRTVPLPCGGSLVIEQTEALVAIDVNSGRFRVPDSAEETAFTVNLEAVDEIARQLRLRDLGGLIILDLIDMIHEKHRRTIERRMTEALKKHKERAKILRISRFGIMEMTRQRQRASFAKNVFQECTHCGGSGRVKAVESVALDVMRQIRLACQRSGVASIDVRIAAAAANDLLNRKRHHLTDLERTTAKTIRIHGQEDFAVDEVRISCTDVRGREVPGGSTSQETIAGSADKGNDRRGAKAGRSTHGGRSRRSSRRRSN